jgi:hypothetical protein
MEVMEHTFVNYRQLSIIGIYKDLTMLKESYVAVSMQYRYCTARIQEIILKRTLQNYICNQHFRILEMEILKVQRGRTINLEIRSRN